MVPFIAKRLTASFLVLFTFRLPRFCCPLLFSTPHILAIGAIAPVVSVPLLRTALSLALSKTADVLRSPVTLSLTVLPLAHTLAPDFHAWSPVPLFEMTLLLADTVVKALASDCATRPLDEFLTTWLLRTETLTRADALVEF